MSKALHADIDRMAEKVYTVVDKDLFHDNLVNLLTQYHSMDDKEDKSAISTLRRIFKVLSLKVEAGVVAIGNELDAALVALCRQADGRADGLGTHARIKEATARIGEVRLRENLEYDKLVKKMEEKGLAVSLIHPLCDPTVLQKQGTTFAMLDSAMTAIAKISPSLTEFMAKKDDTSMARLVDSLMVAKTAGASTHAADAIKPHFNHSDTASGIKERALVDQAD